jgi:predicted enzyme related to lactoylglutathione lyase
MSAPVVHFEIGSKDTGATAEFYRSVFDWQFADTGSARLIIGGNEGGPTGMLNALGHPPENYVLIYIRVDDIDAALTRVTEAGGKKLVGPIPLPDGRRFAWIEDTAGNTIGLLTPTSEKL